MSRFPFVLFWLAGFIFLGASIQYECFVNRFAREHSRHIIDGRRDSQNSENPKNVSDHDPSKLHPNNPPLDNGSIKRPTDKKESGKNTDHAANKLENRQAKAEEQMGKWTLIGAIVALIGVPFFILTLAATAWQAWELRKSNEQMWKTHDGENRPWISVGIKLNRRFFRGHFGDEYSYNMPVAVTLRNCGPKPAFDVRIEVRLGTYCSPDVPESYPQAAVKMLIEYCRSNPVKGDVVFPDSAVEFRRAADIFQSRIESSGGLSVVLPFIYGVVVYTSPHIKELGHTSFIHLIGHSGGELMPKYDDWSKIDVEITGTDRVTAE